MSNERIQVLVVGFSFGLHAADRYWLEQGTALARVAARVPFEVLDSLGSLAWHLLVLRCQGRRLFKLSCADPRYCVTT